MPRQRPLAAVLLALALLYGYRFHADPHLLAALLVFVGPALILLITLFIGWKRAPLSAGLLALAWFTHGVMSAWTQPLWLWCAWLEILLSLIIIGLVSIPGLRARFSAKRSR